MDQALKDKVQKIKVLALDVDGVLTDGKIVMDHTGQEMKAFNVKDGYGIVKFKRAGYKVAIITARSSKSVEHRAKDMQVDALYQDAYPKEGFFDTMCQELDVRPEDVCFVGDDLPDIPVMKKAGLAVTVADGVPETRDIADYVTTKCGGNGAVREVIELIMKTQGRWEI